MILLNVEQGSDEWLTARLGIPTASGNDRILTPKKLERASQAKGYRNQLLTEWLIGEPIDWGSSSACMERGKELEERARAHYEWVSDVDAMVVGFMLRDDRMYGASPDSLIGTDGGLEIKCPALHNHIGYMTEPSSLVEEYRGQVQGNLYVSGREWWDIMSYNPSLPEVVVRVERDEKYIHALDETLKWFTAWVREGREILAPHRPQSAGKMDDTLEMLLEQSLATIGGR